MKRLYLLLVFSPLLLLWNCMRDAPSQETGDLTAQLVCDSITSTVDGARYAISALVEESKIKLAEAPRCEEIPRGSYAELGIPATAQGAVGGDLAGQWTFVFWESEQTALRFYLGTAEMIVERKKHFSELARYEKGKYTLSRPLHLADLAGYYVSQTVDTSYVLFLGLRGPYLIGKLFSTPEAMPPQKMLQRALPTFASGPATTIECDLNRLRFESVIGEGSFYWRADSSALHFNSFLGLEREVDFELVTY